MLRNAGRVAAGLVLAILVLLAGLASPPGRSAVASLAEGFAPPGLALKIESLDRLLPWGITVGAVDLADRHGRFLRLEKVAVDLDLLRLARGEIALPSLTAALVELDRLPDLPPAAEPPPEGPAPGLPPLALGRIEIERVALGPTLALRPVALALAGRLDLDPAGRIDGRLAIERIGARTGRLDLAVAREAAGRPLAATLTLKEDADGILLGLAGRLSGPTLALDLQVDADAAGAAARVALAAGGEPRLDLTARWTGDTAAGRLVVDGSGRIGDLAPPPLAPLLDGDLAIALEAALGGGHVEVTRLALATGLMKVDGSGSLGGAGDRFELLAKAGARGGAGVALPLDGGPVAFREAALGLRVGPSGRGQTAEIDGYLIGAEAAGFALGQAAWLGRAESRDGPLQSADRLPFGFQADLARLGREGDAKVVPSLRVTANGSATGLAAGRPAVDLDEAAVTLPDGRASFAGTLGAQALDGRLKVAFDSLAGLGPLAGRALAGKLALDGRLTGAPSPGTIDLDITGKAENLAAGIAPVDALLAGRLTIAARLAAGPDGLAVPKLELAGPGLSLTADAELGARRRAALKLAIPDLARLRPDAAGAADLTAGLDGDRLSAIVTVPAGRVAGLDLDRARLALEATAGAAGLDATVTLDGRLGGRPLAGKASVAQHGDGRLTVPVLDIAIGRNRATGAVAASPDGLLQGRVELDFADLAEIGALALTDLGGRLSGSVAFTPASGRQTVGVKLDGRDIAAPGAKVARLSADATVDDLFGSPAGTAKLGVEKVAAGGLLVDKATLEARPAAGATGFTLSADGRDLSVRLAGAVSTAPDARRLALDSATVTAFGLPVRLLKPTAVAQAGDKVTLDPVELDVAGGHVSLAGTAMPDTDLKLKLAGLPLKVAERFAPGLGLDGRLDLDATVTGAVASPAIAWNTRVAGLKHAETAKVGIAALDIAASGRADKAGTSFDLSANGSGLTLKGSGRLPFAGSGLDATLRAELPLAVLAPLTGREMRLSGRADAEVTARGSLDRPDLAGRILISGAEIADGETQLTLKGVEGRIELDEKSARIERLEGALAAGGRFRIGGRVEIDPARGLPAELSLGLTDAKYADGRTVAASFGAALTLSGPLAQGPKIAGRIDLARVEVTLPERVAGKGASLKPEHRNAPPGIAAAQAARKPDGAAGKAPALAFDVTVAAPNNRLFVRGFGVDAELGGELRLGGDLAQPVAAGRFDLVRGRVELLSRRLDFDSGAVSFRGSLEPTLDFSASVRTSDSTVRVTVTGTASEPEFAFSSTPALPQEEVLARLIFDRGLASLSALQAARLADAAARLSGAIKGPGMFDRIRAATGLDDIDVGQDTTGQTRVGVSKSISDNMRVGVAKGGEAGTGRVTVDLDIGKGVKARGEAGGAGEGKLGIIFEREY